MPRIRTVKPEFWTSEQVMELSPLARLLFIGLWNFCDDRGVHPVAYKTLKAEVFPADDLLSTDVEGMVAELIVQGLLTEFQAEGRRWWFVTGWHHQVINRASKSRYPEPPRNAPLPSAAGKHGADTEGEVESAESKGCEVDPHGARSEDAVSVTGALPDGVGVGVGVGSRRKDLPSTPARAREDDDLPPVPAIAEPIATRKGIVCGLLRDEARMQDAAPHYLTDETWAAIFAKRTNDEIVEFAKSKMALAKSTNKRIGLKYLAPGLLEDPEPVAVGPPQKTGRHMTREESRRIASSTRLADYREACEAEARQRGQDHERTIEATAPPRILGGTDL